MKLGARFLEKPFDDELLLASVRSALDKLNQDQRRQAEREIEGRLTRCRTWRDVLEGWSAGKPTSRSYDLGISPRTIGSPREPHDQDAGCEPVGSVRMPLIAGILGPNPIGRRPCNDAWPAERSVNSFSAQIEPNQSGAPDSCFLQPNVGAGEGDENTQRIVSSGVVVIVLDDDLAVRFVEILA
jgi:hypothetical protein